MEDISELIFLIWRSDLLNFFFFFFEYIITGTIGTIKLMYNYN